MNNWLTSLLGGTRLPDLIEIFDQIGQMEHPGLKLPELLCKRLARPVVNCCSRFPLP